LTDYEEKTIPPSLPNFLVSFLYRGFPRNKTQWPCWKHK